ncbi:NUDIX hydrolase [Acidisoma cellulosilytica]|uniref:GDP-mannose pyrophosphatase n=1 Tax=Acidisoma cellulosilyticum TaxID=2802395 RepID=A0A963YXP9_9PROT|nr:NUDIX hydrolase [Acidisoma cellulosilyticum]MCB8879142.1 NUDIX hydrolase [Acidisoma cellulosilyticum]
MTEAITQISSRLVYENRWLRLREDKVRRLDGSEGIYSVLERAEFAVICPVQDGEIYLVEQFRYPIGQCVWELPMGTWEWQDVAPTVLAAAELREETGLVAGKLHEIGRIVQAAGYSNQEGRVFFATDLVMGETAREVEEQDMVLGRFPIAEVERMIRDGVIRDAVTIAAFAQARLSGLL